MPGMPAQPWAGVWQMLSLSFKTTIRSSSMPPAWFSASKAMPAVMAPSPMTATTLRLFFRMRSAAASPAPKETEVELWPVSMVSYSLSTRLGKTEMPPYYRKV